MKIAAAEALAKLAREDVPDEVHNASAGRRLAFGPEYIIPNAFDPRLISRIPPAVAKAAMDSGVARKPCPDLRLYTRELTGRLDPTAGALDRIMESVRSNPKRVVFAEGEEEKVVRAAVTFRNAGYGTPVLIGREERVRATHGQPRAGADHRHRNPQCAAVQRQSQICRVPVRTVAAARIPAPRLPAIVNQDRNVFAAAWLRPGMPTRWSPD